MNTNRSQNKSSFKRFWKENALNLIVALIVTMVICIAVGLRGLAFPLWVWILIGLVCWIGRMQMLYRSWKRETEKGEKP